jgi:hypothetical protein
VAPAVVVLIQAVQPERQLQDKVLMVALVHPLKARAVAVAVKVLLVLLAGPRLVMAVMVHLRSHLGEVLLLPVKILAALTGSPVVEAVVVLPVAAMAVMVAVEMVLIMKQTFPQPQEQQIPAVVVAVVEPQLNLAQPAAQALSSSDILLPKQTAELFSTIQQTSIGITHSLHQEVLCHTQP